MNSASPKRPARFDAAVLTLSATLILAIGLVILLGSQIGVRVQAAFVDQVGPLGPLTFTFSVPVDAGKFKQLVSFTPELDGTYNSPDSKTIQFTPRKPFDPDVTYQMLLRSGEVGQGGETIRKQTGWSFHVRPALVAFTSFDDDKSSLMIADLQGGAPRQLAKLDGSVFDFDVSPNGEFLIASVINAQSGIDLWYVDRAGQDPRLLLDCGSGRCMTPSVSPETTRVAYTREDTAIVPGGPAGAPRIWIVDLASSENSPLLADSQIVGYGPGWSPDGTRLSFYDGLQDLIRVVTLDSGKQVTLSSDTGDIVSWSPDGDRLLFTNVEDSGNGLRTLVNQADLASGEIANLLGSRDERDYDYGQLAWSPIEEKQVLVGLRPDPDDPARGLWLMDPGTLAGYMIADEPGTTYNDPRWDAWGRGVLFEQFRLKAAYRPEVAVWMPGYSEPHVLAEGLSARWLP